MVATRADNVDRVSISADLAGLEDLMRGLEVARLKDIALVDPAHRIDAINLVHYLALRQGDVRHLQRWLGERGLSSLGRCEAHVLATVESVRAAIDGTAPRFGPAIQSFQAGRSALDHNTDALFGPRPPGRVPRIMVTLPSEAANDYLLVRHLVSKGMDVARINGAHDEPGAWERMARHVRKASLETGRSCRVSMDLPGPKLRTGPLADGPQIVKLRPERNLRGVPVTPATATLCAPSVQASQGTRLPVDPSWLERRRTGDVIHFVDTRGGRRELGVVAVAGGKCEAVVWDTSYVETGAALSCAGDVTRVGELPKIPQHHLLGVGDSLLVTRELNPAAPWRHGQPGQARIGCTLPAAFDAARPGQRVILDDGKITGVIDRVSDGEIQVRILSAAARGSRLRAEKGINLPDTDLAASAVTRCRHPSTGSRRRPRRHAGRILPAPRTRRRRRTPVPQSAPS